MGKVKNSEILLLIIDLEKFKEMLAKYGEEDIIFTSHAEIRALFRNIDLDEIKNNILNPEKLANVIGDERKEKYECYFAYSRTHCHKYVLALNRLCVKSKFL